jgi:hypothetical protein
MKKGSAVLHSRETGAEGRNTNVIVSLFGAGFTVLLSATSAHSPYHRRHDDPQSLGFAASAAYDPNALRHGMDMYNPVRM